MKVVLYITGSTATLIGVGYSFDGGDVIFFKGTEQECRIAAKERNLKIDEMEKTPYYRDFEKTTFAIGDEIYYVSIMVQPDGYSINDSLKVTMTHNSFSDRVHCGCVHVHKQASDQVGLYQCVTQAGNVRTGAFYCSAKHPDDIIRLRANIRTWISEHYTREIANFQKRTNEMKIQKLAIEREARTFAHDNKDILNGIK